MAEAVRRCGRIVIAAPEPYVTELLAAVTDACFYDLDAPVARVSDPTALRVAVEHLLAR